MRISRDEMFIEVAHIVAKRGTCPRAKVGAVLVNEYNKIVSIGYNGSPSGEEHCEDVGCLMENGHCIRTTHAEINCVEDLEDALAGPYTLYVTHAPCTYCSERIARWGAIVKVIYDIPYRYAKLINAPLQEAGIKFEQYKRT
jgi:dCMP deaminase